MDILNDPEMREIVIDFCDEAGKLYDELDEVLDNLEDDPTNQKEMENFGQIIDRVMGAAKSIGANEIGKFCELGKAIGYKASQITDEPLLEVSVAVLFDANDLLKRMTNEIKTGESKGLEGLNTDAFVTRLKWLSEKYKSIDRASVSVDKKESKEIGQADIDNLLEDLGL